VPINFCAKKLQSQNITREKLCEELLYKKIERKMLVKLTPSLTLYLSHRQQIQVLTAKDS